MPIYANGRRNSPPYSDAFVARAKACGAKPVNSLEEVVAGSDIVFSSVVVSAGESVGLAIAQCVRAGQLVADINSTEPDTKRRVAAAVEKAGADYVDVALMGSVKLYGAQVPLHVSGPKASRFEQLMTPLGCVVRVLGDQPGTAAQLKMLRSLAMKSMGMVILESVLAGAALGIREQTFEAIRDSMEGVGFAAWTKMGMQTNGLHARRRADEIGMAINLLRANGVDPVMASAAKERLERLLEIEWPPEFQEEWPEDYEKVLPHYQEVRRPWPGLSDDGAKA